MAKRKSVKTRTRTIVKRVRARAKKTNTIEKFLLKMGTAAAYGAVRPMIAQKISPLVQNLSFGQYADEVGMLILTGAVSKYSKNKILNNIAEAGFAIESAFLGQQIGSNFNLLQNNSSNTAVNKF